MRKARKKDRKRAGEVKPIAKDFPVCQNCKYQVNSPSSCTLFGENVGRKNKACDKFKVKKR